MLFFFKISKCYILPDITLNTPPLATSKKSSVNGSRLWCSKANWINKNCQVDHMVYHHLFMINYWRYWTILLSLSSILFKLFIKFLKKKPNWPFITFRNKLEDKFSSCCLSSSLMRNITCQDTLEKVLKVSNEIKFSNLLLVLMDGLKVKWSLLE